MHTGPGEEAQIDFGAAGPFVDPASGRARSAWVFVMTLGYSRHQYAELVFDQTVRTWIACHRQAFAWFGGVPRRLVLDNLKAAVLEAALHDPVLGEAYRRMAQHYGVVVSPTRPRTPEHKGKVESGVHFVKRSFLAGHAFADLRVANEALRRWIVERAGTREHGTTHEAPLALFEAHERAALLPLPAEPFELRETRSVKVHPDCHVVIDGSYYSVPYAQVGAQLDAFVSERVVELFRGTELIATHPRATAQGELADPPGALPRREGGVPGADPAVLPVARRANRTRHQRGGRPAAGGSAAGSVAIGPGDPRPGGDRRADPPRSRLPAGAGVRRPTLPTDQGDPERRARPGATPRVPEPVASAGPGGYRAAASATSPATAPAYAFERTAAELFPEDVLVTAPAAALAPVEVSR